MRVRGGNSVTNAYLKKLQSMSGGGVVEIGEAAAKRQTKQADALNKTMPGKLMPELSLTQARQIKAANTPKATKRSTKETEGETEQTESDWIEELESPFETRKQTDRNVQPKAEANKRERARQAYANRKDKTDLGKLVEDAKERSKTDTRAPAINSRAADLQQQYGAVKQIARDAEMAKDYFMSGLKSGGRNLLQGAAALGSTFADAEAIRQANEAAQEAMRQGQYTADTYEQQRQANAGSIAENADTWIEELQAASAAEQQALAQQYADRDTLLDKGAQTIAGGIGGMVPTIAAGLVNPALGLGVTALQGGGSGYTEALEDGATRDQARAMGVAGGALAAGTEALLGGIPGVKKAGGLLDDAVNKAAGKLGGKTAQGIAKWGIEALGEGAEEAAESALNEAAAKAIYGRDTSIDELMQGETTLKDIAGRYGQDFAGGALVGGVLGGLGEIPELVSTARKMAGNGPQIGAESNAQMQDGNALVNQQMEADTNQMAGQEAGERAQERQLEAAALSAEAKVSETDYTPLNSKDLADYIKAGTKGSPRHRKEEMIAAGESPILENQAEIEDFIGSAIYGNQEGKIKAYGKVGSRLAEEVFNKSDGKIDISGRYLELPGNDLKHAWTEHRLPKREGDIPLSEQDFKNIAYYIDTYDDIITAKPFDNGSREIQLAKKIDGYTVITEIVSNQRGAVQFKNMWGISTKKYNSLYKSKSAITKGAATRQIANTASALPIDGALDAEAVHTSAVESVPQAQENVNAAAFENAVPELDMEYNPPSPAPEASDAEPTAETDDENRLPAHAVGAASRLNPVPVYEKKQAQTNTLQATAEKHGLDEDTAKQLTQQESELITHAQQAERGRLLIEQTGDEVFLSGVEADLEAEKELNGEDLNAVQYLLDKTLTDLKNADGDAKAKLLQRARLLARAEAYTKSEAGRKLGSGDRSGNRAAKAVVNAEQMLTKVGQEWADENGRDKNAVDDVAKQTEELLNKNADLLNKESDLEDALKQIIDKSKLSKTAKKKLTDEHISELAKTIAGNEGSMTKKQLERLMVNFFSTGVFEFSDETMDYIVSQFAEAENYDPNSKQYADVEHRVFAKMADQLGDASWGDKVRAWRYLSMLSSSRTSIKNTLGNFSMGSVVALKDVIKTGVEAIANNTVLKNNQVHTASVAVSARDNGAAYADADARVFAQLKQTDGRYEGVTRFRRGITGNKRVFKNDFLEGLRRMNSGSLEAQDEYGIGGMLMLGRELDGNNVVSANLKKLSEQAESLINQASEKGLVGMGGVKNNYARSAAQYAKANGESFADLVALENEVRNSFENGQAASFDEVLKHAGANKARLALLNEARAYGVAEALKATFHNKNAGGDALSRAEKYLLSHESPWLRGVGHLFEAIMPFKNTPANVLARGIEYSPVGALGTVVEIAQAAAGKGSKSNAQLIDQLAAGLTGSALTGLGYLLAQAGLVALNTYDDDRERYYKQGVMGEQSYSLNLADGSTYSLDWLAPTAIPLFVGVALQQSFADQGSNVTLGTITDALANISEPILETTMLSGLNDTLNALSYASEGNKLASLAMTGATNYLAQFVPTVAKQVGRSFEEYRSDNYSGKESMTGRTLDKQWNRSTNWIPELQDEVYYDQWGRPQENVGGNTAGRLAYNLLSPGYYSKNNATAVDVEIERLADTLGVSSVYPASGVSTPNVKIDGQNHRMSEQEMQTFSRVKGQTSYDLVEELMDNSRYDKLTDKQKAEAIGTLYSLAGTVGKREAVDDYNPDVDTLERIYNTLGTEGAIEYLYMKNNADTNKNGDLAKGESIEYLENSGLDGGLQAEIFAQQNLTTLSAGASAIQSKYGDNGMYAYEKWRYHADQTGDKNGSLSMKELIESLDEVPSSARADFVANAATIKEGTGVANLQKKYGNSAVLDYYMTRTKADANKNGGLSGDEVKAFLSTLSVSNARKADYWTAFFPNAKTNPYK